MLQLIYDPIVEGRVKVQPETKRFLIPQPLKPTFFMKFTYTSVFEPTTGKKDKTPTPDVKSEKLPMNAIRNRFGEIFLEQHLTPEDWQKLFNLPQPPKIRQIERFENLLRLAEASILLSMEEQKVQETKRAPIDPATISVVLPGEGMAIPVANQEPVDAPETYANFLETAFNAKGHFMLDYLIHLPKSMDDRFDAKIAKNTIEEYPTYGEFFENAINTLTNLEPNGRYDMCGVAQKLVEMYDKKQNPYGAWKDGDAIIPYILHLAVSLVDDPAIRNRVFPGLMK